MTQIKLKCSIIHLQLRIISHQITVKNKGNSHQKFSNFLMRLADYERTLNSLLFTIHLLFLYSLAFDCFQDNVSKKNFITIILKFLLITD